MGGEAVFQLRTPIKHGISRIITNSFIIILLVFYKIEANIEGFY